MSHALGLALQGCFNDRRSLGLIVLRLAPASGGDLPDLPEMPCSRTRVRHSCTVGRLTPSSSAIDTLF